MNKFKERFLIGAFLLVFGLLMIYCILYSIKKYEAGTDVTKSEDLSIFPGAYDDLKIQSFHGYKIYDYQVIETEDGCKIEVYISNDPDSRSISLKPEYIDLD